MSDQKIVVRKGDRRLDLIDGESIVHSYPIALGSEPLGSKRIEGDGKTPEGRFYIFGKNVLSKYTLAIGISYPGPIDAMRGLESKLISPGMYDAIIHASSSAAMPPQKTGLGGEIYIHGGGLEGDWTEGCIALDDEDIKQLFDAVEPGMSVEILP